MKMMKTDDMIAKAKSTWEARNEPLFRYLREINWIVPEPNIEFHPEDGELKFVWLLGGVGIVTLSMDTDPKTDERSVFLRVTRSGVNTPHTSTRTEWPSVKEVVWHIKELVAKIPEKTGA